jgi:hypothetical protein
MNERNGIPSDIKQIINDENEASKTLSKKQRQKRRQELSSPSMISARLSSLLAERFPPSVIGDHLAGLLSAVTVTRDGREIADVRSREAGLKLLLAYGIGKPAERSEVITINVTESNEDIQAQIDHSPALRQELAKMIGAELK